MKNLYSILLILLSSIFVNNAYSQFVKNPSTSSAYGINDNHIGSLYLDENAGDESASNIINESFLHLDQMTSSRLGIKIPVFYDDDGTDNDYMNKCWLRYKFLGDNIERSSINYSW